MLLYCSLERASMRCCRTEIKKRSKHSLLDCGNASVSSMSFSLARAGATNALSTAELTWWKELRFSQIANSKTLEKKSLRN